jgi:hypothetical protein
VIRKIFFIVKMLEVQKKEEEEISDAACSSSIAALTRQENRG